MIAIIEPQPLLAEHLGACVRAAGLSTAPLDDARFAVVCVDAPDNSCAAAIELLGVAELEGVVLTTFASTAEQLPDLGIPRVTTLRRPFTPGQLLRALREVGAFGEAAAAELSEEIAVDESDVIDEAVDDEAVPALAANEALDYATASAADEAVAVDESDVLDELTSLPAFASAAVDDATMRLARTLSGEVADWAALAGEERVRTIYAFLAAYARGEN